MPNTALDHGLDCMSVYSVSLYVVASVAMLFQMSLPGAEKPALPHCALCGESALCFNSVEGQCGKVECHVVSPTVYQGEFHL